MILWNLGIYVKDGKDAVNIMKEYLDNDYLIVGLLGIKGGQAVVRGEKGILMESCYL